MNRSKIKPCSPMLRIFLFVLGMLLMPISIMHISIVPAAVLVNAANVYLRRSPLPVILLAATVLMAVPSLIGTIYFDTGFPIHLCLAALGISALTALLVNCFRKH